MSTSSSSSTSSSGGGALSTGLSWPVLGAIAAGVVLGVAIVIWVVLRTCRKSPTKASERNLEAASASQQNLAHPLESYIPPSTHDAETKTDFPPTVQDNRDLAATATGTGGDESNRVTSLQRSTSSSSDAVSHDSQGLPKRSRRPTMSTFGGRNISIIPVISEVPDVDIHSSDDDADDHDPENFLFIPAPTAADLLPDPTPPQPVANVPFAHRAWASGSNAGTPVMSPATTTGRGYNSPAPPSSLFSSAPLATPLTASTLEALRVHANVAQSAARDPALKTPPLAMAMLHGPSDVYHSRGGKQDAIVDDDNGPPTPGIDAVLNRIISSAKPEELRRSLVFGPNDRVPGLAAPAPAPAPAAEASMSKRSQSSPLATQTGRNHDDTVDDDEAYDEVVIVGEEERSIVQPAGEASVSLARSGSVSSQVHPDIVKSSLPRPPRTKAGSVDAKLDLVTQQLAATTGTTSVPALEAYPIQVVSPDVESTSASFPGSQASGTMRARPPTMIALPDSEAEAEDSDDGDDDDQPLGFSIHPAPVARIATPVVVNDPSPHPSMVPLPAGGESDFSAASTPETVPRNA
ncbi:hypothetical protein BCR44DRAFT_33807 [Catenaria anguillulae PL171]|uniref:Uncharacterized protein n=1 Tax=Catenaria anguillulae PL171 TaxID=765915 RepID=A0A1Y2HMW9_9FUNG|nr:hypothetical protein BCR44DRAFT_33807 [Catenaria anguillulae PL171]